MNEIIKRIIELHRRRQKLEDQKAELRALVSNPKPVEYKAVVVQTSTPGGNELVDYVIRAEEIDAQILAITSEMEALQAYLESYLPQLTERERRVIELRFFRFERWPIIAKEIYGDITRDGISNAMRIRRRAVRKLDSLADDLDTPDLLTAWHPQC